MNNNRLSEDKFAGILKETELEIPSEQFSINLARLVVSKYEKKQVPEYSVRHWLGKCILAVLIFFNLLFLFYLNYHSVQPIVTFSVAAFVIGFWALIPLMRKMTLQNNSL